MLSATQSPQGLPVGNNGIGHAPAGEQDPGFDARSAQTVHHGKRKADSQENERLSKRLSLLNIEKDGKKVYVPVEAPSKPRPAVESDSMQMDDSKHKVYIYDIDEELGSDDDSDSSSSKLVFLPDIEKHLRETRIPPHILLKDDADSEGREVVLYSDPKSLTVPEEQDNVRKAIADARRRVRERQQRERRDAVTGEPPHTETANGLAALGKQPEDAEAMELD